MDKSQNDTFLLHFSCVSMCAYGFVFLSIVPSIFVWVWSFEWCALDNSCMPTFLCMPLTARCESWFSFGLQICLFSNFLHFLSVLLLLCWLFYSVPFRGFHVSNCLGFLPRFTPKSWTITSLLAAKKVDLSEHMAFIPHIFIKAQITLSSVYQNILN